MSLSEFGVPFLNKRKQRPKKYHRRFLPIPIRLFFVVGQGGEGADHRITEVKGHRGPLLVIKVWPPQLVITVWSPPAGYQSMFKDGADMEGGGGAWGF